MREELERHRESVEAQLRWAMLHDGDRELLELLQFEGDALARPHQGERRAASSGAAARRSS
jgi:hypothetical protein